MARAGHNIHEIGWNESKHFAPSAKDVERTSSNRGILKGFGDILSKIRDIQHPIANRLADSIQKTHEQETSYVGKFLNSVLTKGEGLTKSSDNNLVKAMRYELENNKPAPITMFRNQKELATFRQARASLSGIADEHIANKEPIITSDGTRG